MTDLLTKDERKIVERAKALLADKRSYGISEWVGIAEILLDIVDDLSKRGVKKYTEQEIAKRYSTEKKVELDETGNWFYEDWKECQQIIEHARFLGALEEK